MIITTDVVEQLSWNKMDNLLPCIAQDATSGKVLMQGYMTREAIMTSLESKQVTFFSRSKQRLWTKGESSGNTLKLVELSADCDQDSLLALCHPQGPTCHTGSETCWPHANTPTMSFIHHLDSVISHRKEASSGSSYTASLFESGIKRIAQKVGEEGVETALAATVKDKEELKNEAADLLYHLLVLLQASEVPLEDVVQVLRDRHK